jgi:hypothetical protein
MLDLFPEEPHQNPSISSDSKKAFYNNTTAAFLVLPPSSQQGSAMQGQWNGGVLTGWPVASSREQGEERSSRKSGQKAVEDFSRTTQPFHSALRHLKRSSLTQEPMKQNPKHASTPASGTGAVHPLPFRRKRPPSPSTTLRETKRLRIDQQTSMDVQEFSVSASHRTALLSNSPSPLSDLPPHINASLNVSA